MNDICFDFQIPENPIFIKTLIFLLIFFVCVFERLTRPETVHAEAALRENSSTSRDDTLEPTTDKMRVRAQNWTSVLHLLP